MLCDASSVLVLVSVCLSPLALPSPLASSNAKREGIFMSFPASTYPLHNKSYAMPPHGSRRILGTFWSQAKFARAHRKMSLESLGWHLILDEKTDHNPDLVGDLSPVHTENLIRIKRLMYVGS
ncbi:uncharacterized protein LOC134273457 [Saccostrea cucullata]|uniref:uncharacterized protein LOC134273457 n=1 Tax=Saccostrea cuccullata TaxID=36930 RepID=UPI002ED4BC0D